MGLILVRIAFLISSAARGAFVERVRQKGLRGGAGKKNHHKKAQQAAAKGMEVVKSLFHVFTIWVALRLVLLSS